MAFLLTNLIILFAHYTLVVRFKIARLTDKIIFIFVLFSAQIILTILVLGIFHWLYLSWLIAFNLTLAALIILLNNIPTSDILLALREDFLKLKEGGKLIFASISNILLTLLFLVVTLWMFLASHLLPPRGVDDITYHLPAIYEYIIQHRIYTLPTDVRIFFAFPQNAELLFLWPTIFFHNVSWIGLIQFFVTIAGIIIVYALARILDIKPSLAYFVAIQFLFAPLVLAQAGSAYIDTMTSVYFLLSLYLSVQFYRKGGLVYLYMAALSMGLMIGMKYSMLAMAVILQMFIVPKIFKEHKRTIFIYVSIIFLAGGYWYVKNLIELKSPFYPMSIFHKGLGVFDGNATINPIDMYLQWPAKYALLFIEDTGLGSFHGGFGLTFLGIAFPCWVFVFLKSIQQFRLSKNLIPIGIWVQFILGYWILFMVPLGQLYLCPRYSIFIIPIGLLAMGTILSITKNKIYTTAIKTLCCIFSILAVVELAIVRLPSYRIDAPIKDLIAGKNVSKNKYLKFSSFMPSISYSWELLDLLTKDDPKGLSCYVAIDGQFYFVAPTYGINLQNRVWNLQNDVSTKPDALIYYLNARGDAFYFKTKIPLEEAMNDPYYELILKINQESYLFVRKDFIDQPSKRKLLAQFHHDLLTNE